MPCVCDEPRVSLAGPVVSGVAVDVVRPLPTLTAKGNETVSGAAVDAVRLSPTLTAKVNATVSGATVDAVRLLSTTKGIEIGGSHVRASHFAKADGDVLASSGTSVGGKRPSVVIANASRDANGAKKM
ncbi:hypothetical protein SUGI_1042550 [Cryptomeria japonica]|nr:hypothetical protein SUGI_1042550 [Cryptomeria japonica]